MNLSAFDLNLLRVLDALLGEQSTLKAAARIGLSQPAVSAALGRLRHAFNDPRFVCEGQRIVPTPFAKARELPLRTTLDRIEALLRGPSRFDPAGADLAFKIAGTEFYAEMLMPALAMKVRAIAPAVRLQLIELRPDDYVRTLESHGVDAALAPKAEFAPWEDWASAFRSRFVVAAKRSHARLKRAKVKPGAEIPLDLYCDLDHVVFSTEGNLTATGDAALAKLGRQRRVAMTTPVFSGVAVACAETEFVGLLPEAYARKVAPRYGLSLYQAPMSLGVALICLIWHKRNANNPAHAWLREIILEVLGALSA